MNFYDVKKYSELNDKLARYQWFISPYYCWMDLNPLIEYLSCNPEPSTKRGIERAGRQIANLLIRANLGFDLRAVIVFEGYRVTPNMSKFSHLIEAGLFELYKLNFITCLGVWMPTVEGVLRSLLGSEGSMGKRIERMKDLRAKQEECQSLLDAIVRTITPYLGYVFYGQQRGTEEAPAYNFNRHLFSHQFTNAPTYCRSNCLRLLNIFDSLLAIDFIVADCYHAIFDGRSERIKDREKYYESLMGLGLSAGETTRLQLLSDHEYFDKDFYFGG